jgi:hypothetical protein
MRDEMNIVNKFRWVHGTFHHFSIPKHFQTPNQLVNHDGSHEKLISRQKQIIKP